MYLNVYTIKKKKNVFAIQTVELQIKGFCGNLIFQG